MKRTGLKIHPNKHKQMILLTLFDEAEPNTYLKIELEPDMVLIVAERLLSASKELNQKPTQARTKQFLVQTLKALEK